MIKPTRWEMVYGYALAAVLGVGFWTWVGVTTAVDLAKKALEIPEEPK